MSRKSNNSLLGKLQSVADNDMHSIIFVCQTCGKGFQDEAELTQHNLNGHENAERGCSKKDLSSKASGQTESANQRKEDFSNRKDPNFKDGNSTEQEREEYSTFEFEFITYSMEDDSATSNSVQRKKTDQAKLRSTRTYKCSICSEEFAKKKDLTVHHSSHPDFLSRSVTCSICSKIFSHTSALVKHQRIHSGEKPFKCDICEKAFNAMCNLVTHKRIHSGEKPFVCKTCGKGFSVQCNLTTHARIHSGEKPFQCDFCDRSFSVYHNMVIHKRIHSGEKPFTCEVCSKGFRVQCNLLTHMRTHSGEKPFVCKLCGKNFRAQCNLNTHMHVHSTERPHVCETCGKAFSRLMGLERHRKIHIRSKRYECEICNESFSTKRNLQKHEESHKPLSVPEIKSASFVTLDHDAEKQKNINRSDSQHEEYSIQVEPDIKLENNVDYSIS